MWVLQAAFDSSELGKLDIEKQKLLKPGSSYLLGRKGHPLIINHKRISRDHCEFIVGKHTLDDVAEPDKRPTLEVVSKGEKDKNVAVFRGDAEEPVDMEASGVYQLQDGDRVKVLHNVTILVSWRPLCAYSSTTRGKGSSISSEACAALGIKMIHKPHPSVTHHLMPHYVADLSTAASLLSLACLVKAEWLQEVLRLGSTPASAEGAAVSQLEYTFALPSESSYRPAFSPSLLPKQKTFAVWALNEARLNMFANTRFLCIREKTTAADALLGEAVHRGAGSLENFDVHSGTARFRQALRRGFSKAAENGMVVVADADAMQAATGREMWEEYVAEAKSCSLEILPPSKVVQAVLDADVKCLLSSVANTADASVTPSRSISPLVERVPNTIADEPSLSTDDSLLSAPPPRKPLVRRVTRSVSREPSVAPPEPEVVPRPRRALTRLVRNDPPFITGLNDPSIVIDGASLPPPTPVIEPEPDYTAPPPPRSRLKRRVGVPNPDGAVWGSALAPLTGIAETVPEEPPLKKFKALFEASEPQSSAWDALQSGSGMEDLLASAEVDLGRSQTQSQTLGMGSSAEEVPRTAAVREEEEEMTQLTQSQVVGGRRKRALEAVDEDAEMKVEPPAKRQATSERDMAPAPTSSKPRSMATVTPTDKKGGSGAAVGKPDMDSAFLKAIASTKRGKKTEDAFDREFNKLKISKPEVEKRDPEEEWAVLADFGDDSGLRGNFMTVVEMDVFRRDGRGQTHEPLREWDGKPNYKKFKKKLTSLVRGAKVEVFLAEENDYGMGSAYWKGASQGHSQMQNATFSSQQQMQTQFDDSSQDAPSRKATARAHSAFDSEGEDATPAPVRKTRKGPAVPKKAAVKAKAAPKKQALFLGSDDDMDVDGADTAAAATGAGASEAEAEPMTQESPVRPTRTGRAGSRAKKAAPIIVDDDSDGGAVFKGFKGRKAKGVK